MASTVFALAISLSISGGLQAQEAVVQSVRGAPTLNLYGVTGLIDMPSGESAPDAELATTISKFGGIERYSLTFQFSPRLSGSFRYAAIRNCDCLGFSTYYDRSFDVRYRLLDEGRYLPAVTVGLQDFVGTGISAGEYVVATKAITPRIKLTAGLGWGRLGSYGSIGSPFGERPRTDTGLGGKPNYDQWFRGPAAPFGGIEWLVTDKLGLKLEYSSDIYRFEDRVNAVIDRKSPINFGVEYQATPGLRFGAYYLYGSEIGVSAQLTMNPSRRTSKQGVQGPGPLPVVTRPPRSADPGAWSQDWVSQPDRTAALRTTIGKALMADGMSMEALSLTGDTAQLRLRNRKYDSEAQAIGHAVRILTATLPASVEVIEIVPVIDGLPASKVTFRRTDIETLELAPNGSARLLARTVIADAGPVPETAVFASGQKFSWGIAPFTRLSLFDPKDPVRIDLLLRLSGKYEVVPGVVLSGALTQKLAGDLDEARKSNSVLQHVRTDTGLYDANGDLAIETLTAAWYARPARNIYSRVTVGYLERMFGGISTEVLWKPVDSRLGIGAELNYVGQRNFDQRFGFQDYTVLTGHVSGYYEFRKGYLAQIDVGRYLAGDIGATVALDREFANGWKVGAFATFTDVSSKDFGEGSFDKGIRFTMPLTWITGDPSRKDYGNTIRPIQRDGGQRLNVDGRLYETVRDYHTNGLEAQWGRVFR